MSNMSTTPSAEYLANLLIQGIDTDNEAEILDAFELMRNFIIANGKDTATAVAALEPAYVNTLTNAIEATFATLETAASDPETSISIFINDDEAEVYIRKCNGSENVENFQEDVYFPVNSLSDLGPEYTPWFSGNTTYGRSLSAENAVGFYQNHKEEIIATHIVNNLQELSVIMDFFIKFINQGLSNKEIMDAFENLDVDVEEPNNSAVNSSAPALTM